VVVAVAVAAITVVACWLAFNAIVEVIVVVAGDWCWLWLRYLGRIAISYSCNFGLFLHLAAIRFCFGGFGDFGLQW